MMISTETMSCNLCGSTESRRIAEGIDFEYQTCDNSFRIDRCERCGLVYLKNRPTIDQLGTIYPPSYIPYKFSEYLGGFLNRLRQAVQKKKIDPVRNLLPESAFIVDVGAGSGELLYLMRVHGPSGWKLMGVDFSQEAVDNLQRLGIEGEKGRFEAMEWRHPKPDLIIMNQVIEHLDDPQAVLKKSFEVLPSGGLIMIETPSYDGWDARLFSSRYWGGWHFPRHWNIYTEDTLSTALKASGFEIQSVQYLLSPNFWLQSIHHMVSENKSFSWLAPFFDVKHFFPLVFFSAVDLLQVSLVGKTSNFRVIARKR